MRALRMTVAALHQRMNKRFSRLGRRIDARFKTVDARFRAVDAGFDEVDKRFDAVDARFDVVEARLALTDAHMRAGFDSLRGTLKELIREIRSDKEHHTRILNEHEDRIKDIDGRVKEVERRSGT